MQKAKIIVAVRKRPLFQKQKSSGYTDIITVNNGNRVIVSQMKQKVDLTKYMQESIFNFDYAFGQNSNNEEIYSQIISPLIDSAFEGAKVSCFAYGQTGSGKTFTMNGVISKNIPGLYTLGAYDIFQKISQPQFSHLSVYLSFYQIYCTKLYDLLNKRTQLILRQDAKSNINVVGLSEIPISNVEEFQSYLKIGSSQRVTSQNSANSQSSRSHAILQIALKNGKKGFGKVYFIDLAGNQRGADHMNQKKQTQIDGQEINKSLLQLKQCIRGLDQGKNHVPFRGSKLTMCLKDSFIGFCRTVMIGNISPSSSSSQNTLNTLRYADRVKELKNNEQLTKQQLKNREMMLPRGNNNAIKIKINDSDDEEDIAEKKRKALEDYGVKNEEKGVGNGNNLMNMNMNNINSGKRQAQSGKSTNPNGKSTSVSKNQVIGNVFNNKQISTNNNSGLIQRKNVIQIGKKTLLTARTSQQNEIQPNRLAKNEPMQIQKNDNKSLDMRKNLLSNSHSNQIKQSHQYQQNQKVYHHQTQYMSNNINNNSKNNNNNTKNNNSFVNNNNNNNHSSSSLNKHLNLHHNYKPTPNFFNPNNLHHRTNNIINPHNLNQMTEKQNQNMNFYYYNRADSGQNNMIRELQQQQNNFMQNKSLNFNVNNNMTQANYPYHHHSDYNHNYVNPKNNTRQPIMSNQQTPMPQSWNQLVSECLHTHNQASHFQLHEKLISTLYEQQNQLINSHSNTLQYQIQKIKQQMQLIKMIEHDRSSLSSKEYAKIMYESIDDKISQLEMLKEQLNKFMYKLDDMEEIQSQYSVNAHNGRGRINVNEELLE